MINKIQSNIDNARHEIHKVHMEHGLVATLIGLRDTLTEFLNPDASIIKAMQLVIDLRLTHFQKMNGYAWNSPQHVKVINGEEKITAID